MYRTQIKHKVVLFGHFGAGNLGNESTLQAMLCNLRRLVPDSEIACVCTVPEKVARDYQIATRPISETVIGEWRRQSSIAKVLRKLALGIPIEVYRWLTAIRTMKGTRALIIPGTGLLTDAYGLRGWGPYNLFKWSVVAKLCGCRLLFVSVGAGPLYTRRGRFFVKTALRLADFSSYRDVASKQYLERTGFSTVEHTVSPDLAFSLPECRVPKSCDDKRSKRRVGLGIMEYAGRYSVADPKDATFQTYLESLAVFAEWLLANNYEVRLLIGDVTDIPVIRQFKSLLASRLSSLTLASVIDEPISCVDDLLTQLATTDLIVATRFHNVLLALLLGKPTLAISFHHKCTSLMKQVELSEYCLDINCLSADALVAKFVELEHDADSIRSQSLQKTLGFRELLDRQYSEIARLIGRGANKIAVGVDQARPMAQSYQSLGADTKQ
jgi:polysaccharide pyruvyl transferase WcaK-like protein